MSNHGIYSISCIYIVTGRSAFLVFSLYAASLARNGRNKVHLKWILLTVMSSVVGLPSFIVGALFPMLQVPVPRLVYSVAVGGNFASDVIGMAATVLMCITMTRITRRAPLRTDGADV